MHLPKTLKHLEFLCENTVDLNFISDLTMLESLELKMNSILDADAVLADIAVNCQQIKSLKLNSKY